MEAEERQEVLRWRACVPDFSSSELRAARSGGGCAHRRRACALVAGEALGAPMPADGLHWFAGRVGLRTSRWRASAQDGGVSRQVSRSRLELGDGAGCQVRVGALDGGGRAT